MDTSKKRITVKIAGNALPLITDEPVEFVNQLAAQLNDRINRIKKRNFRISTMDALILCSMDDASEKQKLEKRIRTLEAQAELQEMNLQNLRSELEAAKKAAPQKNTVNESPSADTLGARLRSSPADRTYEENIRYLESLLTDNNPAKKD